MIVLKYELSLFIKNGGSYKMQICKPLVPHLGLQYVL